MRNIIIKPLNGSASIAQDSFEVIKQEEGQATLVPPTGKVLIDLTTWQANKPEFVARAQAGGLGVYLNPDDDPESLKDDLQTLQLIAFHFPVFKYGQGYSGAVLLRTRHGYTGEIRAFGDIWRDQCFYLARCGFTQFDLKEGKSLDDALQAFTEFTTPYQTSADGNLPIFSRRVA